MLIRDVSTVPEGDGVDVKRLFPLHGFMYYDPFVLCDHFNIGPGRGFPDHPHRGFEAITYMFEGGMQHKDNLGNTSFVTAGGAQRFTAGKGMVHSEMPAETANSSGIQLWINLPAELKQIQPDYQQVDKKDFPRQKTGGVQLTTIVGKGSPLKLHTPVEYLYIQLDSGADYHYAIPEGMRGMVYIMQGNIRLNQQTVTSDQAVFIENDVDQLIFSAQQNSRFIICMGKPHQQPIIQHGPFVD